MPVLLRTHTSGRGLRAHDVRQCQHEFCWLCLHDWTRATHDASFCTGRAEASHSEILASVERQIRSNWAQQAHDTRPAEDTYAEEVLQRFRVALTTHLESDAELLSAEDADVPLRWRRILEFYDRRETRIRATAQVAFAGVVDSHRAQQELIELLSWVRDRRWLRLSPEDVDAHNESFMDPQAFLELPCPVRRRMHAERALVRLKEHFGSQLVEYERNMAERTRQEVGANRAEVTSALEAVAANNAQFVVRGNVAFEQRDRALRQTARVEFDGYRAHLATEMQEDVFARVEARIAEVRDFFRREHCEMFAAALREEAYRELISVEDSNDRWTQSGFLRASMKSFLWLWLLQEIVAENTEQECDTVFCAIGIKVPMVPYLNETCMSLSGMSSGPHGQTSAPAHEFSSVTMNNEVCYKSCSLHKGIYSALQRDHCVCFDSHSGSPADLALCNVNCPGNSSQFCGGDSWYTFHLMYLWVAPVEATCSGMPEPVGNNMPTSTTVCLDYFNETVPCISTCPSGQHLASHEPVCDPLLRRSVVRQRCFEIMCASVSHVAHAEVQSLCEEGTENSGCDIKCIELYTIASNTLNVRLWTLRLHWGLGLET